MSLASEHILSLKGVGFSYEGGESAAVSGLDLGIGQGEFVALLGPNGSGKSTILKLMSGILRPTAGGGGSVSLWNKPLNAYRNRDRAKLISYLPQMLDMHVPFTVSELVGMGLYPYERATGPGLDDALAMVGLKGKRDTPLTRLSGGERRRAFIAMTLLQGAGILLLDEPLANLDVRYQGEIVALLGELNRRQGIAIVMALHDISLAMKFKRLVLLKEGSVVADGPPAGVLTEDTLSRAFDFAIRVREVDGSLFIQY